MGSYCGSNKASNVFLLYTVLMLIFPGTRMRGEAPTVPGVVAPFTFKAALYWKLGTKQVSNRRVSSVFGLAIASLSVKPRPVTVPLPPCGSPVVVGVGGVVGRGESSEVRT